MNSLPLRRHSAVVLLAAGLASAELASIRRKVEENCPEVFILDNPDLPASQALAMQDQIERPAIRHTNEYRITSTDSLLPNLHALLNPASARPTRYVPHVGRKQLSKKNGTR